MAKRKRRVAFINTHPIQYFAPLYAFLSAADDFEITGLYLSDFSIRGASDSGFGRSVKWDIDLLDGYAARFVGGADKRDEIAGFFSAWAPGIWREVRAGCFDAVVVHGHTPVAMLLGSVAAKAAGIPVLMRAETHLGVKHSGLKGRARRPVMKRLYGWFDGMLAIGSANAAFYRSMDVPERKIFFMPYTVDNERFSREATLSPAERIDLRASFGVRDERPIILFAAKLQPRKRPDDLLRAVAKLNREGCVFHVVIVGSGEMDQELHALAAQLNVTNVHFSGFANQAAMPRVYGACDVFVLPSSWETWGLAVNEAMCAGLPVVASAEIGCAPDLIRNDSNGRTFAAGDIDGLAAALAPLLKEPELRRRMGASSRDIISRWSYAECRDGLGAALEALSV